MAQTVTSISLETLTLESRAAAGPAVGESDAGSPVHPRYRRHSGVELGTRRGEEFAFTHSSEN